MDTKQKRGRGRPKAENPLKVIVKCRLTEEDAKHLDKVCKARRVIRADYIRGLILSALDAETR